MEKPTWSFQRAIVWRLCLLLQRHGIECHIWGSFSSSSHTRDLNSANTLSSYPFLSLNCRNFPFCYWLIKLLKFPFVCLSWSLRCDLWLWQWKGSFRQYMISLSNSIMDFDWFESFLTKREPSQGQWADIWSVHFFLVFVLCRQKLEKNINSTVHIESWIFLNISLSFNFYTFLGFQRSHQCFEVSYFFFFINFFWRLSDIIRTTNSVLNR